MKGLNNQVWATSILNDDEVRSALVLCFSLKRVYTSRQVVAIVSPNVSKILRNKLYYAFDMVYYVQEDENSPGLEIDDFVKLSCFVILKNFDKAVYLCPTTLVMKNADDIFEGYNHLENRSQVDLVLSKNMTLDIFLFKPSFEIYDEVKRGLEQIKNGKPIDLGSYLKKWRDGRIQDGKVVTTLDEKYTVGLQAGEQMLLGDEKDFSIVNVSNVEQLRCEVIDSEILGMVGKFIVDHWLKMHAEDVTPLMDAASVADYSPALISSYHNEHIAIVGMSCRFPGSNNLEEFWNLLIAGGDGTSNPPPFRWKREQSAHNGKDCRGTNAGFLSVPVDEFDAKFFGVSPKEVHFMDPQHRLLHEVVWEGLEDACINPHSLKGTPGSVFVGSWTNDYKDILNQSGNGEFFRAYMGNSIGAAAARISHLLQIVGPSVATESGCSSAMVAVHLACRSLQLGESNMALACGVNMLLHPFDKDVMPMVLSPDGHCKTFCEKANGFARAEGCGALVLKRLSDAVKDGDNIWALVRGSAVTQEGVSRSMGTPTVHCESLVMMGALRDAHVTPEEVSYVEMHGTGTVVGDPMEVAAVAKAYSSPIREGPLIIGSVKTNVGHTESCSGITGMMKVVLAMHNGVIPAHRNFEKLNPYIDLDAVPVVIPLEPIEWKNTGGKARLAGVSSFGITGTDAHIILEESPKALPQQVMKFGEELERPLHIVKLSAKTDEALAILLEKYQKYTGSSHDVPIQDLAFAGNVGRADFNQRVAIIARTNDELLTNIQQSKFLKGEVPSEEPGKICFLFTGQGSQYPGMAKQLYETSPVFRMHFQFCEHVLKHTYGIDIGKVLWGTSTNEISRTIYSQTSIFCVEYALLKLWESWGVIPDYALGHSLGEFAAAVCAGILTVQEALKLVAERSRLIDQLPPGKMLVVKADQQQVEMMMKRFGKTLDYAAINSPEQTVLAGDSDEILEFSKFCTNNAIKCIILEASHAFHSRHMDPMLDEYREIASTLEKPVPEKCEYISGMKGHLMSSDQVDAQYWVEHTREKVSFMTASRAAVAVGATIFIEVGPQPVLSALTMMNNDGNLLCLPSLKKTEQDWTTLLNTIGKLYVQGIPIDWEAFDQFHLRKKVHLPHYPFMGKKFWPDMMALTGASIHPLLGSLIANASSTKIYQSGISLTAHEFVKDHAIGDNAVFPGAGYLEMCLAAGLATIENSVNLLGKPTRPMKVEELRIEAPLALSEGKTCQVQTVVDLNTASSSGDWNDMSVKICHRVDSESSAPSWLSHAKATFCPLPTAEEQQASFDVESFLARVALQSSDHLISQVYKKLASIGLKFGPIFQSLDRIWKSEGDSTLLAKVKTPPQAEGQGQYLLHPAVLDAMIQSVMMLKLSNNLRKKLYVPIKISKFVWLAENRTEDTYIHAYDHSPTGRGDELSTVNCSALLLDGNGKVLAIMSGVEFIDTTVKTIEAVIAQQISSMPEMWEEVWRPKRGPLELRQDLQLCNGEKFYEEDYRQEVIRRHEMSEELTEVFQGLEELVYCYMLRAMHDCGWSPPPPGTTFSAAELTGRLGIKKDFEKLFGYFLTVFQDEGLIKRRDDPDKWVVAAEIPTLDWINEHLTSPAFSDLAKKFNSSLLLAKVGESLGQILTGKLSPLYLLFPEDTAKKDNLSVGNFYDEYGRLFRVEDMITEVESAWLNYCKEHQPKTEEKFVLRVLEIGAGTGNFSKYILDTLDNCGIDLEYTYTDISAAFFSPAEKKFEKWGKHLTFKTLNIEEDPISQGFTPGYYDYICASDVIHATKNIGETLRNVRTLLKPLGRFDMQEMTRVNRFVTYLFGLLEGFWRFEDKELRPDHCTLSTQKWTEVLESTGFDMVGSFPCENEYHSLICTRKSANEICKEQLPPSSKVWLLFHQDNSPISDFLLGKIQTLTDRKVVVVKPAEEYSISDGSFTARKESEQDYISVMEALNQTGSSVEGIIYCWSLDKKAVSQDDVLQPYFYMVKSIHSLKQSSSPRLFTLTSGVVPLGDSSLRYVHPSTIWGFTKALRNEKIELNCRLLDLGNTEDNHERMMQIFYEIWNTDKETQVLYSGATRYTPKLQPYKPALADLKLPSGTDRFQLVLPETKSIADLQFGPLEPVVLGDEEVEIQVKASSLNFRDVFSVLKPSEEFKNINAVGFDLAGVVKRVGSKVTQWVMGDEVFGINIHGSALPSHVNLKQEDVLPLRNGMSFCEAATLPAVFATAYLCLVDVAKITPSDTVLIHTASGRVGLIAIELCKHLGAKIICTAGSKRKQTYLRSLGIEHIFHSRSTKYGEEILKLTGGRGVDVVLNSLTSEGFKEATLMACAKGARFLEMSKLSIWQPEEVKTLRPDVDYTIVDLSAMRGPELRRLMSKIVQLADERVVNPIPYVRFDGVHIREALQYMQKAKHIGKVVCVMPEVKQVDGQNVVDTPMFSPKGTYLITGGLGGIGFEVCKWMVAKGAKFILLAGRNPPNNAAQQAIVQLNSEYNSKVTPVQLDVSSFEQSEQLIKYQIQEMGYPPLRGVMHCAGILQDGLIQNQDWPTLSSTLKTKVDGTLNLHELTKDCRLEHFVLFSSIAALIGSPGQSNHAAGNNFEDTFAHYRHSIGLPATSINWGQWGQVGVATEADLPGLKPFSNLQGITGLEHVLKSQRVQTGLINVDSFVLLSKLFPHISAYLDEKVWKSIENPAGNFMNINSDEFWERYTAKGAELEGKLQIVQDYLRLILKNILRMDMADVVQDEQDFQEMGVDSLMFVEIKNALQALLGDRVTVNASALRNSNNVKLLSETLVKLIEGDANIENNSEPPTSEEVSALIKEDCELPEHIRAKEGQKLVAERDIKCVLLTGSTGTLGPYMLKRLCSLPQIANVICLVRPTRTQSAEERLRTVLEGRDLLKEIDMTKVSVVSGDVASAKLGMDTSIWEKLCGQVEAIFHCAASVLHNEHYRKGQSHGRNDIRAVNVGGMKNVLEFSSSGSVLKHVFLASSLLAVPKVDKDGILSEDWPDSSDYDGLTTVAYPITKFVGDVLMRKAVQERGIPGKVFRYPLIAGDSKTGRFILDRNHAMLRYLFIMKTGMMPSNPFPMAVMPVDICADTGVKLFFDERCKNDIVNVAHNRPDIDQEFVGVAKRLGYNVDIVEFSEFTQKLRDASVQDSSYAIFKEFYRSDEDLMATYINNSAMRQWLLDGGSSDSKFFSSRKVTKLIPDFYEKVDGCMDCIYRDLLFARKQGWLQQNGLN